MMRVKVWGRRSSANVIKVLWCLEEIGLPFVLEEIGGSFGRNREPWFLALNPNGLVPVIDDGGYVLWESNAIIRYLAARYSPGRIWPEDSQARADADRWMDWPTGLQPFITALNQGLIRTAPENRDPAVIEPARTKAASIWSIADQHLDHRRYLAGVQFTIAELALGVLAYRWFNLELERPQIGRAHV